MANISRTFWGPGVGLLQDEGLPYVSFFGYSPKPLFLTPQAQRLPKLFQLFQDWR
jgi:hypothetical protein